MGASAGGTFAATYFNYMKFLYATASIALLVLLSASLSAQTGKISGKVLEESGQTIIGATVLIKGTTKGAATDIDGYYIINAEPGTYDIQISSISFETKLFTGVEVKAGQITTLNTTLAGSNKTLETVKIEAKNSREAVSTITLEQKNSVVLFDGFSGEQIKRTPDRTTADVLRRVSGATIQDNSFVVVRGLPDRYNAVYINNAPLPSSEPDRKAFAFDIFPATFINDIKVIKTAMPSLSGEFAGGLIQLRTKDIPDKNFYTGTFSVGYNTVTTGKDFHQGQGGKFDFIGVDDGTRAMPGGFPDVETFNDPTLTKPERLEYSKQFNNTWKIDQFKALPNFSGQFSMGHNINFVPKSKRDLSRTRKEMGSVFALTYQNNNAYTQRKRYDYSSGDGKDLDFTDDTYTQSVMAGGIWNLSFLYSRENGSNHRISLKNMANMNTSDQTILRTGTRFDQGQDLKSYNSMYTQNRLLSTQLMGEHFVPKGKIKIEWNLGYNNLKRDVPDYKQLTYKRPSDDTAAKWAVPFSTQPSFNDINGRFYSTMMDNIYSGSVDLGIPFITGPVRHEIKFGGYGQYKDRDFEARTFSYVKYQSSMFNNTLPFQDIDSIFDARNFGQNGFLIREATRKSDTYTSNSAVYAGYLQYELSALENRLRIILGPRIEYWQQELNSFTVADESPVNVNINKLDVLPSINVIGGLTNKMNLRFAASQTVCRPEARELAPFQFYDYSVFLLTEGNTNLKRTRITNLDLRYEYYPSAGQLISVSAFGKYFEDPIEKKLENGGSFNLMRYVNAPSAYVYGMEFEYRVTLATFYQWFRGKSTDKGFFHGLSLFGNVALIQSEVDLSGFAGGEGRRPLQGQSPYIVNAGVQYNDAKYDFGISLSYNRIGERIVSVGYDNYPSFWEKSRNVLDLQLSKTFWDKLELKINARDMLANPILWYQNNDNKVRFAEGIDNEILRITPGATYSFSVGFKL